MGAALFTDMRRVDEGETLDETGTRKESSGRSERIQGDNRTKSYQLISRKSRLAHHMRLISHRFMYYIGPPQMARVILCQLARHPHRSTSVEINKAVNHPTLSAERAVHWLSFWSTNKVDR